MFTHLHVHTEYSLLDGLSRVDSLAHRARELGMDSLAVTDHGALYGVVEFYSACKEAGIRPIIGCELYMARGSRHTKDPSEKNPYHMTVLARTSRGYKNLIKLVTAAHLEGFYYRPRVDRELLERHSEGLIVLSGCPSAQVPRLIAEDRWEEAVQAARWHREVFGDYYMELQRHDHVPELSKINEGVVRLSRELGFPLVATNDSHYTLKEDAPLQDILICIHTNTNVNDPKRLRMEDPSYYLKSPEEMLELFHDFPEAVRLTHEIASRCEVDLGFGQTHVPRFPCPDGMSADEYLAKLCWEGFRRRFPEGNAAAEQRLKEELEVIRHTRFANYFLVVWDITRFVHEAGILFGVRGSAAASIALYCLGVTNVDPLEFRLVFERFLNVERKEMPDIDMDFQDDRRDEVLNYVTRRYGRDRVAQIITFGTLGAKAAVRDVGRALAMTYAEVDQVARLIPFGARSLADALESTPELRQRYEDDAQVRRIIETAQGLEGVARHVSTHAAGVVITEEPLTEYVPLQRPVKGDEGEDAVPMTQYSMDPIAKLGLLKMDFLGLINLTTLDRAIRLVEQRHGTRLSLLSIPLDDRKTYEMLSQGETTEVFQLEGAGMRRYIRELKPNDIRDLAAMVALYRPGPMEHIPAYINRKHGKEPVHYPDPSLKDLLEETYGIIVYQDQVLLVLQRIAGYSLGQADIVRKAMGKKIASLMAKEKVRFLEGAQRKGYSQETAEHLFSLIEPFAGYAFNKAHAVSYALIAYWTAYFKANYPVEYMTAVLNARRGNLERAATGVKECYRLGIKVLLPDVNRSGVEFTIDQDEQGRPAIRFGLGAIKNVGDGAVEPIVRAREEGGPFASIEDFCRRCDLHAANRRVLESLIKAGALDGLGKRGVLLAAVDRIVNLAQQEARLRQRGQSTMFDLFGQEVPVPLADLELGGEDALPQEKESWELELLGMKVSGDNAQLLAVANTTGVLVFRHQLTEEMEGQVVEVLGQLATTMERLTRKGDTFVTATLDLLDGPVDVVVWPSALERTRAVWEAGRGVRAWVKGKVRVREDEVSIVCDDARVYNLSANGSAPPVEHAAEAAAAPPPPPPPGPAVVEVTPTRPVDLPAAPVPPGQRLVLVSLAETGQPEEDTYLLKEVLQALLEFPGTDRVNLDIRTQGKRVRMDVPIVTTNYCDGLLARLEALLGPGRVRVVANGNGNGKHGGVRR